MYLLLLCNMSLPSGNLGTWESVEILRMKIRHAQNIRRALMSRKNPPDLVWDYFDYFLLVGQ